MLLLFPNRDRNRNRELVCSKFHMRCLCGSCGTDGNLQLAAVRSCLVCTVSYNDISQHFPYCWHDGEFVHHPARSVDGSSIADVQC